MLNLLLRARLRIYAQNREIRALRAENHAIALELALARVRKS